MVNWLVFSDIREYDIQLSDILIPFIIEFSHRIVTYHRKVIQSE